MHTKNWKFPYSHDLQLENQAVHYEDIFERLCSLVTDERFERIKAVASKRSFNTQVLLENIYDTGNINAVMRSAENFGFSSMHLVESQRTMISTRTTRGAHKWIQTTKWKNSTECVDSLKDSGYQVVSTTLSEDSIPLSEVDFNRPTLVCLGNERDGISQELHERSDINCIIPTTGFSQSFNISVAGAIILSYAFLHQEHTALSEKEIEVLQAHYLLTSLKGSFRHPEKLSQILLGKGI